ncbi:Ig-like domain-containing protein [Haloarchaeobius litoreus]|uniref:Ig-like domain-containing protein n=1 Tax=Haloarchaeobius litoreus TaxID=755306 RepID=A0ABD6DP10_9EURY|nr:Ig-like domain-containing protein [Haloarchaeobius litoreus]
MNHRHNTNTLRGNDRGVSPVLGGILVFGLVLALLVLAQVSLVPALNQQTEFEHNQRLVDDATEFQGSAYRVATSGGTESVEVGTGVRYRPMAFLVTPAAGNGRVYTEEGTVSVSGAVAADPEAADYWDGGVWSESTRTIVFDPAYREYTTAPRTRYEGTVVVNDFDGTTLLVDEGRLVDGQRVTLLTVDGDLSEESSRSVVLSLRAVSTSTQTVELRNETDPIRLTVPSSLSPDQWKEDVLADQLDESGLPDGDPSDDRHVLDVIAGPTPGTVTVLLEPGVTYEFTMARLGVGNGYDTSPDPAYVTVFDRGNATLRPGELTTVTFEVRDAFNNPVAGVPVSTTASGSALELDEDSTVTTGSDGRATFLYRANRDGQTTVSAGFGSDTAATASATIEVVDPDAGGDPDDSVGGVINPDTQSGSFALRDATRLGSGHTVEMTFDNDGVDRTLTHVRVNLYMQGRPGNNNPRPVTATLLDEAGSTTYTDLDVGGQFVNLPTSVQPTFVADSSVTLRMAFFTDAARTTNYSGANSDDFFVLALTFDDGSTMVYFVPSYT